MSYKFFLIVSFMTFSNVLLGINGASADLFNKPGLKTQSEDSSNNQSYNKQKKENDPAPPAVNDAQADKGRGEDSRQKSTGNFDIYPYYIAAAQHCNRGWSSQECMKTLSEASLVMTSRYAEDLDSKGHGNYLEELKNHCAASTAATKVTVPASAQRSAIVECVNHIVDISDSTGINPDPNFYQLMVGSVFCFDKQATCAIIEQSLHAALLRHNSR